jgi:hypothetical protein
MQDSRTRLGMIRHVRRATIGMVMIGVAGAPVSGQRSPVPDARPTPYPVPESRAFADAVVKGTRTRTGEPGPAYWTNYARYDIAAQLDPGSRTLTGRALITYENRSPDMLPGVALHLFQNVFAPGALRSRQVPVTTGMRVSRIVAGGMAVNPMSGQTTGPGYTISGTTLHVVPPSPIAAGASLDLEIEWSFQVPPDGAPRGGTDGEVFFVSYWYPQVAVYDDVEGWHLDPYQGNAEFYMGYADYDVAITLPEGWLIGSTGELRNADDVLSATVRERLSAARSTRQTTHVVTAAERGAGSATASSGDGLLTWRFSARNVRDFAFGASDDYLWDATIAVSGASNAASRPDTAMIHTLYRPSRVAWAWNESALFEQHSVEFLSSFLWPYAYPQMTAIDGPASCSGMEYPMITCIGGQRDRVSLYGVLVHETAHMWFPMMVGSNETAHSWQDEGLTRFNQSEAMGVFFDGMDRWSQSYAGYAAIARSDDEVELMRHGDLYPRGTAAFGIASYDKMSLILRSLRGLLGEDPFMRAYREYGRRWLGKHPTPTDLFNTFAGLTGHGDVQTPGGGLWWFWRSWFYETWTLDHAIASVETGPNGTRITVEDRGLVPMPARLVVTHADGSISRIEVPVEVWLAGATSHVLDVPGATVTRVEIDPEGWFLDVDRGNGVWAR